MIGGVCLRAFASSVREPSITEDAILGAVRLDRAPKVVGVADRGRQSRRGWATLARYKIAADRIALARRHSEAWILHGILSAKSSAGSQIPHGSRDARKPTAGTVPSGAHSIA